jgi:hypothetical protein
MRIPVTPEDFKKFNEEYDNRKIKARDYQRSPLNQIKKI